MDEKTVYAIEWDKYLKADRKRQSGSHASVDWDTRNPFESDLGRVIFCPAIRRMHDKTQVIPLTSGDTILTRLTHSMQVMSVAESLAHYYTRSQSFINNYKEKSYYYDACISAILRTAALLHDIGNPPFGHFGEITIQNYFKKKFVDWHVIKERQSLDFTEFDGNALGLRIVSKLQYTGALDGLNLTYPTLGAYIKYPNTRKGNKDEKEYVGNHKHGVFYTEGELFDDIVSCCNMKKDDGTIKRHPLSFLVEAADSICYGIMDLEDGYNANWYTFDEMINTLNIIICNRVIKKKNGRKLLYPYLKNKRKPISFSIEKLIGYSRVWDDGTEKDKRRLILDFRVALIRYLSRLVIEKFEDNLEEIDKGNYPRELLKDDDFDISGALSDFAQQKLISRREIQELELTGNSVINGLLDILMRYAFSDDKKYRSKIKAVISKSRMEVTLHESMHKDMVFKTFEEKELRDFDIEQLDNYRKLRLIVDFVASMTDKYSVELYQKFAGMRL